MTPKGKINLNGNFTKSWIVNNTLGLFLGFLEMTLVAAITSLILTNKPNSELANFAIILAGLFQGIIFAQYQYKALSLKVPKISETNWILLTLLSFTAIWSSFVYLPQLKIFNTASGLISPQDLPMNPQNLQIISQSIIYIVIVSFLAGFFLGYILSFIQWTELSKHVKSSFKWIFFNSLSWGFGFSTIIVLMSQISYSNLLFLAVFTIITFFISSTVIASISSIAASSLKNK